MVEGKLEFGGGLFTCIHSFVCFFICCICLFMYLSMCIVGFFLPYIYLFICISMSVFFPFVYLYIYRSSYLFLCLILYLSTLLFIYVYKHIYHLTDYFSAIHFIKSHRSCMYFILFPFSWSKAAMNQNTITSYPSIYLFVILRHISLCLFVNLILQLFIFIFLVYSLTKVPPKRPHQIIVCHRYCYDLVYYE